MIATFQNRRAGNNWVKIQFILKAVDVFVGSQFMLFINVTEALLLK